MTHRPFSGRRFFVWYAVAWLDLAALYTVVFRLTGMPDVITAAMASVINVVPMALLGLAALAIFRRLDWNLHWATFVSVHTSLAVVFGVTSTAINSAIFAAVRELVSTDTSQPLTVEMFIWESVMGMLIYGVLAGVCYAILVNHRLREQEARAAAAVRLQAEAELKALRAKLNPHFLFNTLHTLLALVRDSRPDAAEEALEQFGDLMRYTLDTQKNGELVSLAEELDFVRNYLALESLRLGDRLQTRVQVDDEVLDVSLPAFTIQPLVENALEHAIAPRAGGGKLEIAVGRAGDAVEIRVADDGPGAAEGAWAEASGLGLRLVRDRLTARYGDASSFDVATRPGGGFAVVLRIPDRTESRR